MYSTSATAFNTAGLAGIILAVTMLLAHGIYVTARTNNRNAPFYVVKNVAYVHFYV